MGFELGEVRLVNGMGGQVFEPEGKSERNIFSSWMAIETKTIQRD